MKREGVSRAVAKVSLKFHGFLLDKPVETTEAYEVPDSSTVKALVERFLRRHVPSSDVKSVSDHSEKLLTRHVVMVNGIGLSPEKQLTTGLKEGDSVTIYLPVSGG